MAPTLISRARGSAVERGEAAAILVLISRARGSASCSMAGIFVSPPASLCEIFTASYAMPFRRAFRDVTTAISAMAKRPFAKSNRELGVRVHFLSFIGSTCWFRV
jgi:hypothetical protein